MPTKQKSGLYRAKIKIGVDENGRDIYKYVSGKTKKELEANRQKAVEYYIDGTGLAEDVLFAPYAIKWYETYKKPFIKPGTQHIYRTVFNKYILPRFGDCKMRAIRVSALQEFFQSFSGMSNTYPVVAKSIFNGIFLTACADRILDKNPIAFIKHTHYEKDKKEKRALTLDERSRIVELCTSDDGALFIAMLYFLGLRRGEAAGLKWADIDWQKGVANIKRTIDARSGNAPSTPKTKSSVRTVPIPQPLMAMLAKQRGMPDVYILHTDGNKPYTDSRRGRLWQKYIVEKCNMPDLTPHHLRHNYITLCWEAGIDVYATARFVGHSSVTTTLAIYTHLSKEREEESIRAVQRIFEF
jgi:integrase